MRVLAIDPGYGRLGVAVLEKKSGGESVLYSDCFTTDASLPFHDRLFAVGKEVERIIKEFSPEVCAVETIFFNTNQKTALRVSETRGVFCFVAKQHGLEFLEYTPLQIKIAVTGYGRATKEQVAIMIKKIVHIKKTRAHDDEYDAIAVGITCLATRHRAVD
ncbi:crossover junction endodeoxyribonuclease RuvC [bacterium]|nr:crossover junction endodeoxyribonuclease RuvC [bacterium]